MTRNEAAQFCRNELDKHNLKDWHIRIIANMQYLGLCSYKDKCIILNAHHCDIHPDEEIQDTIRHEIAHALTPGENHSEVWADKAREIGCTNTFPCSHLSLSPDIIDAIRSGADIQYTVETEIIHKPKYTVTRLQDKCDICGKVAKEISSELIEVADPTKPDLKIIKLECGHTDIKKIPKGTPFQTLKSEDDKSPYKFQVEGMKFIEACLATQKGCGVFDEMGLGKTIQALGYLKFHPESFPVLFVVKSGIKFQWFKEILRWTGKIAQIIQSSQDILIPQLDCYIVSYDILTPKTRNRNGKQIQQGFDIDKFEKRGIKTIILDECQQIKNPDATRTQMVRQVAKKTNVIALSGTPWKNRGSEFFTVLNMLAPMKFPSHQGFLRNWVDYYNYGNRVKEGGIKNVKAFKNYIKDIVIRREIFEVLPDMPEVNRTLHYIELDKITQDVYDDEVSDFVKWYNSVVIGGEEDEFGNQGIMIAKLARMRHITGLAKIPATIEFAEEFIEETNRKLTIFVHHKDVGELIYRDCEKKFGENGTKVLRLTADMSGEDRFTTQEEFNNSERAVLVASTLASGEGINLQTCSDCIMHERQWNPQNEDQAAPGRFRRIGQTKKTNVTFMTASGTVDDILAGIVEGKRAYFHATMNKGEMPKWSQNEIMKELAEGIVRQHENRKGN